MAVPNRWMLDAMGKCQSDSWMMVWATPMTKRKPPLMAPSEDLDLHPTHPAAEGRPGRLFFSSRTPFWAPEETHALPSSSSSLSLAGPILKGESQ